MIGILVMMNNYFHDLAAGIVFVCGVTMYIMVKSATEAGSKEAKELALGVYPTLVHIIGGSIIFMLFAGVIRTFTYKEFEWANAVGVGQVYAIMVKHVILGAIFFYGIALWIKAHGKIKEIRRELKSYSKKGY
ncbi:MAG: hypothetical protein OEW87_14920 [Flavobacteriaceae bacterium]|nr:hypothetical protein [Flavobacteriaceae bacterium]